MQKANIRDWIEQPEIKRILLSFLCPKTPRQVEKELGLRKLKLKPFIENRLLVSLNPEARKGRFYILSDGARKLLKIEDLIEAHCTNWELTGWVMASPKQRLVILQVLDAAKRTSEELRQRARRKNSCLSRISTKSILHELVGQSLVSTALMNRKRYYWITPLGVETLAVALQMNGSPLSYDPPSHFQ